MRMVVLHTKHPIYARSTLRSRHENALGISECPWRGGWEFEIGASILRASARNTIDDRMAPIDLTRANLLLVTMVGRHGCAYGKRPISRTPEETKCDREHQYGKYDGPTP